jgi:hypothetical protein
MTHQSFVAAASCPCLHFGALLVIRNGASTPGSSYSLGGRRERPCGVSTVCSGGGSKRWVVAS